MRDLATAELNHRFHAVAFLQEADGVVLLELVVVVIRVGAELQLLDLDHVLLLLGVVLFLLQLVLVVAIVDGLGDRRDGCRGDQNKVWILQPEQKSYMEMTPETMRNMGTRMAGAQAQMNAAMAQRQAQMAQKVAPPMVQRGQLLEAF